MQWRRKSEHKLIKLEQSQPGHLTAHLPGAKLEEAKVELKPLFITILSQTFRGTLTDVA